MSKAAFSEQVETASVVPHTRSIPLRSLRPASEETKVSPNSQRVRRSSSAMEYAPSPPYQPFRSGNCGRQSAGPTSP